MKIKLIMVGRTSRGPIADGYKEYLDRVRKSWPVEEVVVPEAGQGDAELQRRIEGERILSALPGTGRMVLLDELGISLRSVDFAKQLGSWRDQGTREITFIIGGAYGVNEAVRARAGLVLSLSAMTFTHQMVRMVFAEQLYRALTILAGRPYHH